MGETENAGVLYLDGKPLCLAEMPEITFGSYTDGKDMIGTFSRDRSCSFIVTFKHSKMSRKKFVRNLIKQGYSKKAAKWLAWYCHRKRISYGKASNLIAWGLSVIDIK